MASASRTSWQPLPRWRAFEHDPVSVRAARDFALETLDTWGIEGRRDDILLCVSELATNALVHGGGESAAYVVATSIVGRNLRVAVHDDAGAGVPECRTPDDSSDTGRGLLLVSKLADVWGVEGMGLTKIVWAEFVVEQAWPPSVVVACEPAMSDNGYAGPVNSPMLLGQMRARPDPCPLTEGTAEPPPINQRKEAEMNEHVTTDLSVETDEAYAATQLIEIDAVSKVTLGKYAEDSADKGRYFE